MTQLSIESLAYGGDAVGRMPDGRTAFIRGACPGDVVDVEITEERDRFVRGVVTSIVEASEDRTTPPCPYFGICGGCSWQHVSYDAQLRAKQRAVTDSLARIGGVTDADTIVRAPIASDAEYGYRNKVELVLDPASSRPRLGFHKAGSEQVVPVDECLLLPKRLRKAPKAVGGALRYVAGDSDLGFVRVGLRAASHTKDLEIALWTAPGAFPRSTAAKTLGQALPTTSIVRCLTKGPAKERAVSKVEVLSGKGHWRERLSGHTYAVSAPSFFQVNTRTAEKLVAATIEALEPDGSDRVLDLYSGCGTFTLPFAELAGEVVAVEAAGSAVRDLRRNLEAASLWAEVVGGDAAREVQSLGHFDLVLVDPPRTGIAPEVVAALGTTKPRGLAYVSCDPATLARDTLRLAEAGFSLESATPVDLFPQTYHVETLAIFRPRS